MKPSVDLNRWVALWSRSEALLCSCTQLHLARVQSSGEPTDSESLQPLLVKMMTAR